jgi:hypothetical protein
MGAAAVVVMAIASPMSKWVAHPEAIAGSICNSASDPPQQVRVVILVLVDQHEPVLDGLAENFSIYPDSIGQRKIACQGKKKRFFWGHDSRRLS